MSKYKHKNRKNTYDLEEGIKAEKVLAMKVKKVEETLIGPKHKVPERCAIFDPVTEELITDENETLKYNIGVLTKNKVTEQDLPEVIRKNELHEKIMKDTTKGEPLTLETYKAVLKHVKKKKKNIFRHINQGGAVLSRRNVHLHGKLYEQ